MSKSAEGIRGIRLLGTIAGLTRHYGDLGADVIRIEKVDGSEDRFDLSGRQKPAMVPCFFSLDATSEA